MTRRGHETDAKSLHVVINIVDSMNFKFTSITRSCIDLTDGKAATQVPTGGPVYA
ncbi:MAG: hypothetical protein FD153_489, partial [Rhodospirillaceae bacterium]